MNAFFFWYVAAVSGGVARAGEAGPDAGPDVRRDGPAADGEPAAQDAHHHVHLVHQHERLRRSLVLRARARRRRVPQLLPRRRRRAAHLHLPVARHGLLGTPLDALPQHDHRRIRLPRHIPRPKWSNSFKKSKKVD
jgi:hypothetical protein